MKKVSTQFLTGIIVLVFSGMAFGGVTYTYTTNAFDGTGNGGLNHEYAYSWKIDLIDGYDYGFHNETETLESVTLLFSDIYDNTNNDNFKISVLDSNDVVNGKFINNLDYSVSGTQVAAGIYKYDDNNWSSNYFTSNKWGVKDGSDEDTLAAELLFKLEDVDNKGDGTNNLSSGANEISVTYKSDGTVEYTVIGDDNVPLNSYATTYNGSVIDALTAYISNNVLTLGLDPDCHYYASSISLILNTSDSMGASHAPEPETLVLFGLGLLGASAFGRKRFSSMG